MYLHLSIIHFLPFCDGNSTDSFLTIQLLTKTMKKLVQNYLKMRLKNDPINRNGEILSIFDHIFSDRKY